MNTGTVISLNIERGFGFVRPAAKGEPDVFFHLKALQDGLAFDETLRHRRVEYITEHTNRGPRCRAVYPAGN